MLKIAMIFSDNMVLQRGKGILVWGEADPGSAVEVEFDGTRVQTAADHYGKWVAILPPHEAGHNYCLLIFSGHEEIALKNVCVGEVWLAGGQSNMEYFLGYEKNCHQVLAGEMNPSVRFFDYPQVTYEGQLEDYDYCNEGFWRCCTVEDLPHFSAVGYYFANKLQSALDVPVGIIGCNWGGTPACAWMDPACLEGTEGEVWLREFEDAVRDLDVEAYKKAFRANPSNDRTNRLEDPFSILIVKNSMTPEEQAQLWAGISARPDPNGPWYERRPGGLYETMLKKVSPYGIKGIIWYQGETDEKHPEEYKTVFSKMIHCWRELWKEELPFLFVQLAPFGQWFDCGSENYPAVRESQEWVSRTVPNTWMASIGDAGMEWDIHPKDKRPVGERLALLARRHVYGQDVLCDAPEFSSAKKVGSDIEVCFDYNEGLKIEGDALQAMVGVCASGEHRVISDAVIDDGKLLLRDCSDITTLQFARTGYYEVNLFNAAGIPAKPFEVTL